MKIAGTIDVRTREERFINIQPIQAAGRLPRKHEKQSSHTETVIRPVMRAGNHFRLERFQNQESRNSTEELAQFVNMDHVRVVPGAAGDFQAVTGTWWRRGIV